MKTFKDTGEILEKEEKVALSKPKIFFYIFCGIVFLFFIFYFGELTKDIKLFAQVRVLWLVVALVAQLCTYLSVATIYKNLLKIIKEKPIIKFVDLLKASIVSLFVSQTIPSGGISGNVFINNFIKGQGVNKQNSFYFVLIELLTFYLAMAIMIVSIFLIYDFRGGMPVVFILALLLGLFAHGILASVVGLVGNKKATNYILKKISLVPFLRNKVEIFKVGLFEGLENPWRVFKQHPKVMTGATFLQVGIFLFDSFTIFALFHGLNVSVSFLVVFVALVLTKSISSVPISPGELLIYEGSMTFFFIALGVPLALALIVTIMFRILSFWLPMPIGLYFYKKLQKI